MKSIGVLINPAAGGGRGRRSWTALEPRLRESSFDIHYIISTELDDMGQLALQLLESEPDYLLIIGGDGTLNHAINAFIHKGVLRSPKTQFAYFNSGCGGDFARQFPVANVTAFLERMISGEVVQSDIGQITLGDGVVRYFINIASCGLSGSVVHSTSKRQWVKKIGGTLNYLVRTLLELRTFCRGDVRITIDEQPIFECSLFLIAICNGQYFGGGMRVAPSAKVDDGLMDVVLFRDFTKIQALLKLPKIYFGAHLQEKQVMHTQAKSILIEPLSKETLALEADGEFVGVLPARFEILAQSLSIVL